MIKKGKGRKFISALVFVLIIVVVGRTTKQAFAEYFANSNEWIEDGKQGNDGRYLRQKLLINISNKSLSIREAFLRHIFLFTTPLIACFLTLTDRLFLKIRMPL